MNKQQYIERYWRDATPADAIKEPPMMARFRDEESEDWFIDELVGFDRSKTYKWCGETRDTINCQVYDAPDPKYVPFTWEYREQLRGRWITREKDGYVIEDIAYHFDSRAFEVVAKNLLQDWHFLDTGEPVGRKVQ